MICIDKEGNEVPLNSPIIFMVLEKHGKEHYYKTADTIEKATQDMTDAGYTIIFVNGKDKNKEAPLPEPQS